MANLPIPDETTWIKYENQTGDGPFSFSFSVFAKADLRVKVGDTELSQSGFTFTGTLIDTGYDGGSIELVTPAAAEDVLIWREVTPARTSDFAPASSVSVLSIDAALDRLTAHAQDARRDLDRAIKVSLDATNPADTTYDEMIADAAEAVSAEAVAQVVAEGEAQVAAIEAAADAVLDPTTGTLPAAEDAALAAIAAAEAAVLDPTTGTLPVAEDAAIVAIEAAGAAQVSTVASTPGAATYADTTAGLAATADQGYFNVAGTGNAVATLYKDNAGVAVEIGSYPKLSVMQGLIGLPTQLVEMIDTQSFGQTGTPVTGTNGGNFTFIFNQPVTVNGSLEQVKFFALATGTVKVRRFTKSGNTFTQVGSDLSITVSATGINTKTPTDYGNYQVNEGEYLGWFGNNIVPFTVATGLGYFAAAGDVTSFTDSTAPTTNTYQIGFTLKGTVSLAEFNDVVAAISEDNLQIIGRPTAPTTGTTVGSARTYVWADPVETTGKVDRIWFWALTTGTVYVQRWTRDTGTNLNTFVDEIALTASVGLNTFVADEGDFEAFDVTGGTHYIGLYVPAGLMTAPTATADGLGYWTTTSARPLASFTGTTPSTSSQIQAGFFVSRVPTFTNRLDTIRSRLDALEDTTLPTPTEFDFWLVVGQSNAVGVGATNSTAPQAGIAYEWNGSALVALADPTSTEAAAAGSAWPAFATEYTRRTGRGVILVNMAKPTTGFTGSPNWSTSGTLLGLATTALASAQTAATSAGYAWKMGGVLYCMGENDAGSSLSESTMTTYFNDFNASLKTTLGASVPIIISQTGTNTSVSDTPYATVRSTQRKWVQANANVFMGFTGAYNFVARGLMKDTVHYSTAGYVEMGTAMAVVAATKAGDCA